MSKIDYYKNQKVGLCVFIEEVLTKPNTKRRAIFKCICGKYFEGVIQHIKANKGLCKICSDIKKKENLRKANTHHGLSKTKEHSIWRGMINRCTNPKCEKYYIYGGKGIKVCKEWLGENGFLQFYKDMGLRPSEDHSIERLNNNDNYYKENCKWATRKEQCRNRSTSRIIEYKGESKTLAEWSEILGIRYATLSQRVNEWNDIERAFTEPLRFTKKY